MYQTSEKWKKSIYENPVCAMNIYIDDVLINPDYILDFKKGGNAFEEEFCLGGTPSQYIEMKIYKKQAINPKKIKIEYGILINNALTVAEVNTMLVGTLNGIPIKSLSSNDSSFEMIPIGIYNVDDYTDNDDNTIAIKALDNMIKFEFNYDGSELVNKKGYATLLEVVQDICNKAGVELGTTSFLNSDKKVSVYDNIVTAREYISYIAESAGCFAIIDREGKLCFREFYQDETEIPLEIFGEYKWGEEFKISKVSYEDGVRSFKFGDDTRNSLWINQENMYIVDEEQIENIYNKINSLVINSFEGKTVIDPSIDIGDKIIIDGKSVIYQGEMSLEGRFIAQISSKIQIKQKEETTVKKESSKVIKRRVQSEIDQVKGEIEQLVEETTEQSSKLTKVEQTVDSIAQKVEDIEDLTQTTEGIKTITLENCVEGDLIELHIYGNNTVFNYLYPQNDLYPNDDLYPKGDSRIIVSNFNSGSEENNWHKIYELGIADVLRQNGSVYDEYILKDGKAQIIRRINKDGTIKNNEEIEDLGVFQINLGEETNVIEIQNYSARLSAKFAIKSDYTDIFATKVEMNSSITQTAEEINLEVKKKVDENEVISKINQSAEEVQINANKISLDGKQIDLTTGKISIISDSLNIDKSGRMILKGIPEETETQPAIKIMNPQDDDMYVDISSGALLGHGQHVYRTQFYYNMGFLGLNNVDGSGTIHTPSYSVYRDSLGNDNIELDGITGDIKCIKLTQTSKESKKKNITKYNEKALNIVKDSEIYTYNFKSEDNKNRKHIGFVIGDAGGNYKTPEQVISNDREGIDNYSMTSILWKAFQEYVSEKDEQIEQLQNKIKELEEKING